MGGQRGLLARLIVYTSVPLGMAWGMNHYTNAGLDADDRWGMVFWFGMAFLIIELNAIAARLFRNELSEQTWSTLTLLPRSLFSIVFAKLGGAAIGLIPGVLITVSAYACSQSAQQSFARGSSSCEWMIPFVMIVYFVSATSLTSMLLPSLPPAVLVFCGLLCFFAHYALTLLAVFALQSRGLMGHKSFNIGYATFWSGISACYLFVAFLRLRKLTASN
jgi:hypothetical protein